MDGQPLSLNQIKEIELDILLALAKYCDEHGLRYFLAYGSLLGAIRHGGFIPWDDDIDIVMQREDYMKLNELLSKENIRDDLRWISLQTGNWNEPIGKVVNINTSLKAQRMRTSIWVDVFPLDPYDEKLLKKNVFMRRVHIAKNTDHFTFDFKGIVKFILRGLYSWKSFMSISKDIEKRALTIKPNGKLANMVWASDERDYYDESMFASQSEVEFEGRKIKTVADVDGYLTKCYGNYMQLPAEKERKSHGITAYWIGETPCPFKGL